MTILDASTTQSLLDRLQRLDPETRARWGKMNARQMLCHLSDSFAVVMGLRPVSTQITFLSRTLARWVGLHLPLPWPKGLPTRPEVDALSGGTPPLDFERDAAALRSVIQRFGRARRDFTFSEHPTMGKLTEWEWMRWGYLHTDHHLRQFGL